MLKLNKVIIGAGITGLSCAYHLKENYILLEKESTVGGLCRTISIDGFKFDYTGHAIHLHNSYTKNLIRDLIGEKLKIIKRNSFVYILGKIIPYPFQANLAYLDEKYLMECLTGLFASGSQSSKDNFYDWCLSRYGKGICKIFLYPYNEKLWLYPLDKMTTDWAEKFIPQLPIPNILYGAFFKTNKKIGYNVEFYYPKNNGLKILPEAFLQKIKKENLFLNSEVVEVNYKDKIVIIKSGEKFKYEWLISTIPLVELLSILKPKNEITELKNKLIWRSVLCLNLALRKNTFLKNSHWTYFPEKKYLFYRIGTYTAFSSNLAPKGMNTIYIEISYNPANGINKQVVFEKVVKQLCTIGLINSWRDIKLINIMNIPYAYVVYNYERQKVLNIINSFLKNNNIITAGRYGAWKYSFIEECILDGKNVAEILNKKI